MWAPAASDVPRNVKALLPAAWKDRFLAVSRSRPLSARNGLTWVDVTGGGVVANGAAATAIDPRAGGAATRITHKSPRLSHAAAFKFPPPEYGPSTLSVRGKPRLTPALARTVSRDEG
jgi:hypothetical protein